MNILKNLRKPYIVIFLAYLTLFISCQQYDFNHSEQITFEKFIESHIEITSEMYSIISNEKDIVNSLKDINNNKPVSFNSFNNLYKQANINEHEKLAKLSMKIYNNVCQFLESNPSFSNLNEKQRNLMIENEITYQISNDKSARSSKSQFGFCEDERDLGR